MIQQFYISILILNTIIFYGDLISSTMSEHLCKNYAHNFLAVGSDNTLLNKRHSYHSGKRSPESEWKINRYSECTELRELKSLFNEYGFLGSFLVGLAGI